MQEFQGTLNYPALVFVYADWCGYCRRAKPLMEQVATRLGGSLPVVAINGDHWKAFIDQTLGGVKSYPTLLYVNTIGQIARFEDERSFQSIMNFVCDQSAKVEGRLDACDAF